MLRVSVVLLLVVLILRRWLLVVLFTLEVRIIVVLLLSSVFRLLVGFLLVMFLKELRLLVLDVRAGRLWDTGLRTLKSRDSTKPLARLLLLRCLRRLLLHRLCLWMLSGLLIPTVRLWNIDFRCGQTHGLSHALGLLTQNISSIRAFLDHIQICSILLFLLFHNFNGAGSTPSREHEGVSTCSLLVLELFHSISISKGVESVLAVVGTRSHITDHNGLTLVSNKRVL